MNSVTVTSIVVGVVVAIAVVAVIAWLLYKAGFKVKEVTAKAGPLEAKMERPTGEDAAKAGTQTSRIEVSQKAGEGGVIHKSGISAPAQSNADIDQQSTGEGSRIDDSPIELT
jgi:hypothetical protein